MIRLAAREFTRPLTGSSASTIVIFLPLAFLTGVTGAFFKALSLTMASALVISYLVAWLAVPLLADTCCRARTRPARTRAASTRAFKHGYRRLMAASAAPALVAAGRGPPAAWLPASSPINQVGTGFMPQHGRRRLRARLPCRRRAPR